MIEAGTRRSAWSRNGRLPPLAVLAAAVLTVAAGQWIQAAGGRIGVPFPPFYAHWYPYVGALAPVAVLVLMRSGR